MSKKILKRSLALGALMAFVITGSAMATTTELNIGANQIEQLNTIRGSFDITGAEGSTLKVSGDAIVASGTMSGLGTLDVNSSWAAIYGDFTGNSAVIEAKNIKLTGADGNSIVYIPSNVSNKIIDIDFSESMVLNGYNAVSNHGANSSILIDGGKGSIFTANVKGNGIWVYGTAVGSETSIKADTVNISSSANATTICVYGEDSDVDIEAKELTLIRNAENKCVVFVGADTKGDAEGALVNIKATEKATIKGDLRSDSADSTINVDITGYESTFTGKTIINNNDAEINLTLNNGATWNVTGASSLTNATFNAGSVLKINGADFTSNNVYALNGVGKDAVLKVENDAKIVISGGKVDEVYNVAKDFATNEGANLTLQADDALWYVDWTDLDNDANTLQGKIKVKTAQDMVDSGVGTNENKEILVDVANVDEGVNPTVDAIKELTSVESNLAPEQQQKAIAAVLQVGEAGGFTGNVVSVSKQVNGSVGARNSFSGPKHGGPRHRGGHGPSVSEEANGSAIWAQYVHGKDKVDGIDMGGTENAYESQFNGVVLGADFKQVGSYASGIAFNYGEGDSHSKKNVVQSDSEFDFWGVSYYGAVKKQDTNFIFDIGYSESDSDVEQVAGSDTITANPEASTWTAGVKVEKLIDKGAVQIVPYAGLRFMTIDTDEYEAKGSTDKLTYYSTERQNIWLLPVGVSLSQENVYDSGWIVTPKADFSYTWAMGDTDSSMTVNMPGVGYYDLGYTVMDDGSFMATVGLDAQKEDWTFGVAYSYQKGDSTRSDRWYVNARYSF